MDFVVLKTHFGDFPSDLVAKTPNSQSTGLGFYLGSGKETSTCCSWKAGLPQQSLPVLRHGAAKWIDRCVFLKSWFYCDGARQLKLKMHLGGASLMGIICVHTIVTWATPWLDIRMFLFKAPDSFLLAEEYLVFWSPGNFLDSVLPMSFHLHGQRKDNAGGGGNGVALWLITSNSQVLLFGSHIIQNHLMSFAR